MSQVTALTAALTLARLAVEQLEKAKAYDTSENNRKAGLEMLRLLGLPTDMNAGVANEDIVDGIRGVLKDRDEWKAKAEGLEAEKERVRKCRREINPGNTSIPSVEEVYLAVGCPPGGDLISCIRYDKAAAKADRIKAGGLSDHLAGIRAALGCKEGESALAAIERLKRPGWEPTGSVMAEIGNERRRQQTEEGWSDGHDDSLKNQELPRAAACYAIGNTGGIPGGARMWPFQMETWKPADKRRNLIKAGALIIAEVERLDRAAAGA